MKEGVPGDAALFRRIDPVCDRFEAAWKAGQRPLIEEYLDTGEEPAGSSLLRELLLLELDYRTRTGEKPVPGEYHARFPQHVALIDAMFRATDDRIERGQPPMVTQLGEAGQGQGATTACGPPQFPGLEIEEEIAPGVGGMGMVFKAREVSLDRVVAVKTTKMHLKTPEGRAFFVREARSAASLDHPHIVKIFSFNADHNPLLCDAVR